MNNPFITNDALTDFIKGVNLEEKDRSFLLSRLDQMDEEERTKLFNTLLEIYFIDQEEKRAIKKIREVI